MRLHRQLLVTCAGIHGVLGHFDEGASPFAFDPKAILYNDQFTQYKNPTIILHNCTIIDGTGRPPQDSSSIVIKDGKIVEVGPTSVIDSPSDAEVISLSGKTVLPGYVMHHEHLYYHSLSQVTGMAYMAAPSMITIPRLYLAAGVTTARSIGTYHPFDDLKLKEGIDRNILLGPDLFLTAPFIQGDPGYYQLMPEVDSVEAAAREVTYWAARGFHNFKTYVDISRSQMKAAATQAHAHNKNISAHLCSMTILEALDAGIDEIEHGFQSIALDILRLHKGFDKTFTPNSSIPLLTAEGVPLDLDADFDFDADQRHCRFDIILGPIIMNLDVDSPEVQHVFQKVIEKGAIVDSTLGGLARLMRNNILPPVTEEAKSFYSPQRLSQWETEIARLYDRSGDLTPFIQKLMDLDYAFWKAGGNLVVGSDAVALGGAVPGITNLESLELLVKAGIPPLDVIKIATLNGAKALGLQDRGTIVAGSRADLIVLSNNPVDDFSAIHQVETVFQRGVGYSPLKIRDSVRGTIGIIN